MKRLFPQFLMVLMCVSVKVSAQNTVGLITHLKGSTDSGYVLFSPIANNTTYLINKCGKLVHSWPSQYAPGLSVYLLSDGSILRTGMVRDNTAFMGGAGAGGIIEKISWDGSVLWSYRICDSQNIMHHDIEPLPNGNILVIVWDKMAKHDAQDLGLNPKGAPDELWGEKILELKPKGTNDADIVWQWSVWDHLVQSYNSSIKSTYDSVPLHPERIDLNYDITANSDWMHFNSVKYNPDLDQILISNHAWSEIWIIDHSTTTAQAASHSGGKWKKGGDLLYRWGNPAAYRHGKTTDQKLFQQHDPYWIPKGYPDAGKIMVFNNGLGRPAGAYSSIDIITPATVAGGAYNSKLPYLPAGPDWEYTAPTKTDFYSAFISGAQMLPNNNVMVCSGSQGVFFELTSKGEKVWEYVNPVNNLGPVSQGTAGGFEVFRCTYYPTTYAAFSGRNMMAGDPIELNPTNYSCALQADTSHHTNGIQDINADAYYKITNPFSENIHIFSTRLNETVSIKLFDLQGREVQQWSGVQTGAGSSINLTTDQNLKTGIYYLEITGQDLHFRSKLIKE